MVSFDEKFAFRSYFPNFADLVNACKAKKNEDAVKN